MGTSELSSNRKSTLGSGSVPAGPENPHFAEAATVEEDHTLLLLTASSGVLTGFRRWNEGFSGFFRYTYEGKK